MTKTIDTPNGTMKVNTLFTFGIPQQEQPCVQAKPLPLAQRNGVLVELLSQVQPNFMRVESSSFVMLNTLVYDTTGHQSNIYFL